MGQPVDIEKKQKDIYDFLNIDKDCFFTFPYLNQFFDGDNINNRFKKYLYYKKVVMKYFDKIEKYIEQDKEILQEKYGIGELK